jgi:hypothetical protein
LLPTEGGVVIKSLLHAMQLARALGGGGGRGGVKRVNPGYPSRAPVFSSDLGFGHFTVYGRLE